jgi:NTE family protein
LHGQESVTAKTLVRHLPGRDMVVVVLLCATAGLTAHAQSEQGQPRRRIGVAFGGGSARGLAHVGVVRWLEEHHIPIDLIAGTSMGGLIGGSVASGMSADELAATLARVDWDEMFGFSPFRYKNIRRKDDARDHPSRIEFGAKRGLKLPVALNNGQQVDFLLARIAGPYGTIASFDELPTPFRAVAVDLVTAQQAVLASGSLASALRATMSLPGIFPPIERDGMILVDGGAINNVPADIVRGMGADVVIAINVGFMGDTRDVNRSMLALMGQTVDVMMQAATRNALKSADIVINPELEKFGSLDWRRHAELAEVGYRAAEAMKDRLLPLAVNDAEWAAYLERRRVRRKATWPSPEFIAVDGATSSDRARIESVLTPLVGAPLDVEALETRLETFAGLDRYETVGWNLAQVDGRQGIRVEARPKTYAPPFLMMGVSLQNTASDTFEFQIAARYLAFDRVGSGSELRIDAAAGARPSVGAELYRPIGRTPVFVVGSAVAFHESLPFVSDDVVVARYNENRVLVAFGIGVNLGRDSDLRLGVSVADLDASVETGDPGLPELHGRETRARLAWRYDAQDSAVVPSSGVRATARIDYIGDSPEAPPEAATDRSNDGATQAEIRSSKFWSVRRTDRVFLAGGAGASSGEPLPTEQFQLGAPFRLGAYDVGQLRGDNYGVFSAGYLRGVGRLPDFLGSGIFLGGWLETGSAFNDIDSARLKTNVSVGAIADTLVGPVILGGSFALDGAWRYYIGIGRLF